MSEPLTSDSPDLIAALSETIDRTLEPLLPSGSACALIDYPSHSNVGDSAIWLGEKRWLGRRGINVVYQCDIATYDPDRLSRRLGNGIILLSGGGNLGDLWLYIQRFRERVIQDFPGHRIIQLPQSIYFMDNWDVGEARRIFNAHPDLTLLCRDAQSLAFAQEQFAIPSLLCPDMAFSLGALARPGAPFREILWLSRTDMESSEHSLPEPGPDVERLDWLDDRPTPLSARHKSLTEQMRRRPRDEDALSDPWWHTADQLAGEHLKRGCEILSRGKVVITDRLHGHILALLLGIPHVVLDNNYGKVKSFYETWTRCHCLARWAASPLDALEQAWALAGSAAPVQTDGRSLSRL
jgi:pyruvyl transferase EpsO